MVYLHAVRPGPAPLLALALLVLPVGVAGQGTIRGTVQAPPGGDVHGAVVVACYTEGGRCNYTAPHPRSRAVRIETRGAAARWVIRDLVPGEYVILGTKDVNGNGREDAGDWMAQFGSAAEPRLVSPPADGVALAFGYVPSSGAAAAAPAGPAGRARPSARPAAPVAPGRGGLAGIYAGVTRQLVAPGAGSSVASGITWVPAREWMTFFPDGRVFLAMPERGLAPRFDWEGECGPAPAWCATYEVRGNQVRIRWASGTEKVLQRDADGTLWTEDRLNFLRFDPLDGLRLDGLYAIPWKTYEPVRIRFTRDGRFTEENLLNNIGWMILGKLHDPAIATLLETTTRGSGRYEIRENTLELRYDTGRVAQIAMYVFPQELERAVPEEIHIHGHDFRRVR